MVTTKHTLKVVSVWAAIVWVVCFFGVALFPGIRSGFVLYALHTNIDSGQDVLTPTTFITGLIIWNIVVMLAVWLYVTLNNKVK